MDAQTGWRQRGGGVRRPVATSATRTMTNSSRTSPGTTHARATAVGPSRASNQAAERGAKGRKSALIEPDAAPSRWREMRQSIRAKASFETDESRPVNAKIADLCPEDREKVAKLVRRIVEVGTMHEEGEKEFHRQRDMLEGEVKELRKQARQDAEEIRELSDELQSARRKAQLYEERVVVLEESTDAETRTRLEAEQTLDLLKLEVDKLRALIQRQQGEMQRKINEQQEQFEAELQQLNGELKEARELLLKERNERLLDKQKALDQRLERSTVAGEEKLDRLHSLLVQQQQELQLKANEQHEEMLTRTREQQERFDAEMNELKQELGAAKEQLLQERKSRAVEQKRIVVDAIESSTGAESIVIPDRSTACPDDQAPVFGPEQRTDLYIADMQGDLAIFEEVKDLYAEDLFASRRWSAANPAASVAAHPAMTDRRHLEAASWPFSSADSLRPQDNSNASLAPALSSEELSVQEAIERDMEVLLRCEALDSLTIM